MKIKELNKLFDIAKKENKSNIKEIEESEIKLNEYIEKWDIKYLNKSIQILNGIDEIESKESLYILLSKIEKI